MRHRARYLHILALAPVAAVLAGVLGPAPHALAASSASPAPIVVTVDPGHGGPTDRGAIGFNGMAEKVVDLDVGARLAALLRADLVEVVMTRSSDVYVSVARRKRVSIAHHAALVVSIATGAAADARTAGSLVLYPTNASAAFAQTLSDALTAQIATDGVPGDGVQLGDPAWAHNPVPVATVEIGYLTNRTDASLVASTSFRQEVAIGLRDGVEAYMPAIIARRDAIRAWRRGHPGTVTPVSLAPASATLPGTSGFQFGPVIAWLAGIGVVGLVLLFRDAVARVLVVLIALVLRLFGGAMWLRRAAGRRRRGRRRLSPDSPVEDPAPHGGSVYDDIPL
ncbi:MAG: N-acetylmuramoyl-L-alanine amidase [Candidatus Dormiibacterota bacterium]